MKKTGNKKHKLLLVILIVLDLFIVLMLSYNSIRVSIKDSIDKIVSSKNTFIEVTTGELKYTDLYDLLL